MNQFPSKGRWKQMRGRIHKTWGQLTHNPYEEFLGEQEIVEGKIEEFGARKSSDSRGRPRPARM
ncbi:MAG: CsbD family protein [Lysobacteraceae bacterium]|nr:MAG: CsbD family protein [Xanthomonadaceae bacterium]